jgi:hypothetical protein
MSPYRENVMRKGSAWGASIGLVMAVGCATSGSSTANHPVREIDARGAERCEFVGSITESVTAGLAFGGMALESARKAVLDDAADRGATHVMWTSQGGGGMTQSASANAYRCPPPTPADSTRSGAETAP